MYTVSLSSAMAQICRTYYDNIVVYYLVYIITCLTWRIYIYILYVGAAIGSNASRIVAT